MEFDSPTVHYIMLKLLRCLVLLMVVFSGCASSVNPDYPHGITDLDASMTTQTNTSNNEPTLTGWCWCIDRDGDGLGDIREGNNNVTGQIGYVHNCSDPDDQITDGCILPSTLNCQWWCADLDGDGDGNSRSLILAASNQANHIPYVILEVCQDCDDGDPNSNSQASEETCFERIDQNCDGTLHYYDSVCYDERHEFQQH